MSTPTPRTDDIAGSLIDAEEVVPADFARTLERELATERDQLRAEVERLKTCGIVELAAINSSVLEYCKHWEARAERAEAEVERLSSKFIMKIS